MKHFKFIIPTGILIFGIVFCAQGKKPLLKKIVNLNFENIPVGKIPDKWEVKATNKKGPLATWQIEKDKTAPSGKKILSLTNFKQIFGGTFNLCWTNQIQFLNGIITVQFRANKGLEDQGGGLLWRAKDKNNYYIARFNPLEDNFRIYYVKDGIRHNLASAQIKLSAHKWHSMKIIQKGKKIIAFLNGKKHLEIEDNTFPNAGGVGLWTKADAATSFDNFSIQVFK